MLGTILFTIAGVLFFFTAIERASLAIWGHLFVAAGLAFSGFDPRRFLRR